MLAASMAREVMRLEEGDFYKNFHVDDEFPLDSPPEIKCLEMLPTLPQLHRYMMCRCCFLTALPTRRS